MAVIRDTLENFQTNNPYIPSNTIALGQSDDGYELKIGAGKWNSLTNILASLATGNTKSYVLDVADVSPNDQIVIPWDEDKISDLGTKPAFLSIIQNLGEKQTFVNPVFSSFPLTFGGSITLQGLATKSQLTSLTVFFSKSL